VVSVSWSISVLEIGCFRCMNTGIYDNRVRDNTNEMYLKGLDFTVRDIIIYYNNRQRRIGKRYE
jgi:hypothetical protein